MLMLSSSSTSPRSSRPTMLSSSLSARSKLMPAMSRCLEAGLLVCMVLTPPGQAVEPLALSPSLHERLDVHANRLGERGKVVAAFKHGNETARRGFGGEIGDLRRRPGKVGLDKPQIGQRIILVGIKAGRDQDQIGGEVLQRRQQAGFERLLEAIATITWAQRRIEDVADTGFADRAGAWIERHLMGRGEQQVFVRPENVLRAIAVMHVEIDDGNALDTIPLAGVEPRNGDVGENAKAHGTLALGMVPARPHLAKGVAHARSLVHDAIDGA